MLRSQFQAILPSLMTLCTLTLGTTSFAETFEERALQHERVSPQIKSICLRYLDLHGGGRTLLRSLDQDYKDRFIKLILEEAQALNGMARLGRETTTLI